VHVETPSPARGRRGYGADPNKQNTDKQPDGTHAPLNARTQTIIREQDNPDMGPDNN